MTVTIIGADGAAVQLDGVSLDGWPDGGDVFYDLRRDGKVLATLPGVQVIDATFRLNTNLQEGMNEPHEFERPD